MDIIDDIVALLRIVIDYIGIDYEDVQSLIDELNARRRLRFYQTRQTISYSWNRIVEKRQNVLNGVNRVKSDVRHKSVLRILGSYLPLKSVKRFKIQNHLLQSRRQKYMYDSDSDDSVITTTTFGSTSDDDIVWVEEEIGENCVRVRAQKREQLEDCDIFDEFDDKLMISGHASSPMTSTMISSVSSVFQNPDQTQKLSAMEEELKNLRQQIAMLVEVQEQVNKSEVPLSIQEVNFKTQHGVEKVTTLPPPCPQAPPVPPPPPPPPPPVPTAKTQPGVLKDLNTQSTVPVNQTIEEHKVRTPDTQVTSLSDVLKGLGSVKLKSVQRSPGGTPMKPHKRRESNSDPAAVIAQALRKKFASQIVQSPDVDKENDSFAFSSPDNSPFFVGQGKREVKKRIFSDGKKRLSGPLRL